ncbi:MAG: 2Fe-2S iron-sulfur cluster-binding protein [Kiritimatiellae bacterium]|nr:2Fe-2S iron-sulfur cluster-binding protein [Kiritimatiellia bacterium]
MSKLTINGLKVEAPAGATVLDVCRSVGIPIPTLCHMEGREPFTSCMLCLVKECTSGKLMPSCTAPALDGMVIATDSDEVYEARRRALELLLSEHLGDCEAPCRRACPAHMDIPRMIRQIRTHKIAAAIRTVKQHIALPAVLGRICPAPCEKGCRRTLYDGAVAICLLKRFVADADLASQTPWLPSCAPKNGRRVAIVGTGPTGLAAAYYLLQAGYTCNLYDKHPLPGGMLRYGVKEEVLPREVLETEISQVCNLGASLHLSVTVGKDISLERLRTDYHAVVLATGETRPEEAEMLGVSFERHGIRIEPGSFLASLPGVFAAGAAVRPSRMAVRAVSHGRAVALAVHRYLFPTQNGPRDKRFDCHMGKLSEADVAEFMKGVEASPRVEPRGGEKRGFLPEEARREAARCMQCDCRKSTTCALRKYADEYGIAGRITPTGQRRRFERILQHPSLVYEPGKCILCGICVRITAAAKEKLGLTFIGRGFSVRVGTPFQEPLSAALTEAAERCATACPTGALAFADYEANTHGKETQ